jgi:uridine kinase
MKKRKPALLVAIVGGSGAGKTWLAERLRVALGRQAARLSLDDFYRDRSHLPPARRARVNFDDPRAIDWAAVERVLRDLRVGRPASVPAYDFATHCRLPRARTLPTKPVVLMDGLWLLQRRQVRRLFALAIFIKCPARLRLGRRLARDVRERGRTRASVLRQFRETVEPMHRRFVAPQARWADVVLDGDFGVGGVRRLAARLQEAANMII